MPVLTEAGPGQSTGRAGSEPLLGSFRSGPRASRVGTSRSARRPASPRLTPPTAWPAAGRDPTDLTHPTAGRRSGQAAGRLRHGAGRGRAAGNDDLRPTSPVTDFFLGRTRWLTGITTSPEKRDVTYIYFQIINSFPFIPPCRVEVGHHLRIPQGILRFNAETRVSS